MKDLTKSTILVYDSSSQLWINDIERIETLVGFAVKNLYPGFLEDLRNGVPPIALLENIQKHFKENEIFDARSFKYGVLVAILMTAMYQYSLEQVDRLVV